MTNMENSDKRIAQILFSLTMEEKVQLNEMLKALEQEQNKRGVL